MSSSQERQPSTVSHSSSSNAVKHAGLNIVFDDFPLANTESTTVESSGLKISFDDFSQSRKEAETTELSGLKISFDEFKPEAENNLEAQQSQKSIVRESLGLKISFDEFPSSSQVIDSQQDSEPMQSQTIQSQAGLKITFDDFTHDSEEPKEEIIDHDILHETMQPVPTATAKEVQVSHVDTSEPSAERKEVTLSFSMESLR